MIGSRVRQLATVGAAVGLSAGLVLTGLSVGTASASGVPGLTSSSITIGATVPLTGIASPGYNEVAKAARAVFLYVNKKHVAGLRQINYILKDDCYGTPGSGCTGVPNTSTQTNALLSTPGGLFATVGSLGTPTQDSVRALLKSHGTPQLFVNSGSKDWNNPSTYPGLFGFQQSYEVESKILAKYMKTAYAGKKICFLGQSDDFGTDGYQGLTEGGITPANGFATYNVALLAIQGAKYFTPLIRNLQTASCKVVFLDTIPGATAAALGNAKALGFSPQWVISSVGSDPITVNKALKGKGSEVNAVSFAEFPASTDTAANAKLWKTWIVKVLTADKADFPGFTAAKLDGNMVYGASFGVAFVEALKAAGANFTQASFVHLLETTTFNQTPSLVPLQYTSSNHQGLNGGYIDKVKSASSTAVVNPTVYVTNSGVGAVTTAPSKSSGMPSWLK